MQWLPILAVGLAFSMETNSAQAASQLPVELINGPKVEIHAASADRNAPDVIAHGWVRRKVGTYGPISAHLHVEGLDSEGATLELIDAYWPGSLGKRTLELRPFNAKFDVAIAAKIERVRISVQPGRRHEAGK